MTKTLFAAMLSILLFGCAAVQKPAPAAPPPPTDVADGPHQYDGPPPNRPAPLKIALTVPKGWVALGPSDAELPPGTQVMLLNPATKALIMISLYESKVKTPQAACEELAEQTKAQGAKVSKIKVSADGSSASFTLAKLKGPKAAKGKILARVLPEKKEATALIIGLWPPKTDKAMAADFDTAAQSIELK